MHLNYDVAKVKLFNSQLNILNVGKYENLHIIISFFIIVNYAFKRVKFIKPFVSTCLVSPFRRHW